MTHRLVIRNALPIIGLYHSTANQQDPAAQTAHLDKVVVTEAARGHGVAGNLIDELELIYNKARQAAITQEISEIVSGAAAV